MSIAFSSGEIVYTEIAGDTPANFLSDFLLASTVCGWGSVAITDGYLFTIQSKQGLVCKVKLTDLHLGGESALHLQFLSFDETLEGYPHIIQMQAGRTYLLHMNECQIFIGIPENNYYGIQGGIPFVPNFASDIGECTDDINPLSGPVVTYQAFWSCNGNNSSTANFRFTPYTDAGSFVNSTGWSTLLNEDLLVTGINSINNRNRLCLLPVTISTNIPGDFFTSIIQRTRHFTGTAELLPLAFDPLICWGATGVYPLIGDEQGRIRGQIYDAFMPSLDTDLDLLTSNLFGTNWVNYMHGFRFGSLFLALGSPIHNRKAAYIY